MYMYHIIPAICGKICDWTKLIISRGQGEGRGGVRVGLAYNGDLGERL